MMGGYNNQSVYHGTSKARGAILNPPTRESAIEKVANYGMRKPSVRVVI
jgi:hypothetical protein